MFSEAAFLHKERYPLQKEKYQAGVAERLEQGNAYTAVQYIQASRNREKIMSAWEETLKGIDAVVAPTCPITAFDIGLTPTWKIETRGQTELGKPMCTYHTRLANMTDRPTGSDKDRKSVV